MGDSVGREGWQRARQLQHCRAAQRRTSKAWPRPRGRTRDSTPCHVLGANHIHLNTVMGNEWGLRGFHHLWIHLERRSGPPPLLEKGEPTLSHEPKQNLQWTEKVRKPGGLRAGLLQLWALRQVLGFCLHLNSSWGLRRTREFGQSWSLL